MKKYNSKIFWHFTGGPDLSSLNPKEWESIYYPQNVIEYRDLKPEQKAWCAMKCILESKEIWATATEKLYGGYETREFCCVADLYPEELQSHRKYYGNFAIGFQPNALLHVNFNPVLYIHSIAFKFLNAKWVEKSKTLTLEELQEKGLNPNETDFIKELPDGRYILTITVPEFPTKKKNEFSILERGLMDYVKYSYPSSKPGFSFYQEKEWRCFENFKFRMKDVDKLIVPESYLNKASDFLSKIDEAKGISLMSWEFLEKT